MYQRGFSGGMAHMTDTLRRQDRFSYIRKLISDITTSSFLGSKRPSLLHQDAVCLSEASQGCPLLSMSTALLLTGFTLC